VFHSIRALLVFGLLAIIFTKSARSQTTTYTYKGLPFTFFSGVSCPSICGFSGSFTVAQPIAPNSNSISVTPSSYSFTDGFSTVTNLSSLYSPNFTNFSTNDSGRITQWSIIVYGYPNPIVINGQQPYGVGLNTWNFLLTGTQFQDDGTQYDDLSGTILGFAQNNFAPGAWGTLTITSPQQDATYPVVGPAYNVAGPIAFNATASDGSSLSWTLDLTYTTSGGQCAGCTNSQNLQTASGVDATKTYTSMGGQLIASAADDRNDTASGTAYVVGAPIPSARITSRLTNLYKPTFVGYTPQLLCQIAMQESLYRQFRTQTLYGISAKWPTENFPTKTVPSGSYIGLMQVPVTMATAYDWYKNSGQGNSVFEQKIGAVLKYQSVEIASVPGLPTMSGQQIEDSALAFYGGFVDRTSKAKKKPPLHYWIPGTVNGQPAWVLNPGDSVVSGEGITATQYIYGGPNGKPVGVRKQKVPN
jgi:hypothetical protein